MAFIVTQYLILLLVLYLLGWYPVMGIADYLHSKIKKDFIYAIGAIILILYLCGSLLSIIFLDKESVLLWYILTVLTITFSALILLNNQPPSKKIEHPKSLKDFIVNAKIVYFEERYVRVLYKLRFLIYVVYIVALVVNQLQKLEIITTLPESLQLYLSVNEYSFIILFAICEMVKVFSVKSKRQNTNEISI